METQTESFDQIYARLDSQDSAQDILAHFRFVVSEHIHGDELTAAAKAIGDELESRLKTLSGDDALIAARGARQTFRKLVAEVSEKIAAEARKSWTGRKQSDPVGT